MPEGTSDSNPGVPYDRFTDEKGRLIDYPYLEPDPERWVAVLQHDRFQDSLTQFDGLMRDYEYITELHVGEKSFKDLNHLNQKLPDQLNLYIAEDHQDFLDNINHPLFRELETERFTVPKEANIGLAFGENKYRDVINVPENFDHLDIKVPTYWSHTAGELEDNLAKLWEKICTEEC